MSRTLRVTVWNEFRHERIEPGRRRPSIPMASTRRWPDRCARAGHRGADGDPRRAGARLGRRSAGRTDVLLWWGHKAHGEVAGRGRRAGAGPGARRHGPDCPALGPLLQAVQAADGHQLRPEMARAPTSASVSGWWPPATRSWRACRSGSTSRRRRCTASVSTSRRPDELVFVSWFQGGEVFRSGCCFRRGGAASSTSAPATRLIRLTTSR